MTTPDRVLFVRRFDALRPADERARALLRKYGHGEQVLIDKRALTRARRPKQHRLWWGLMHLLWEHQSTYGTVEDVSDQMKVWCGHCLLFTDWSGRDVVRPKSIAFGNMPDDEFSALLDQAIRLTCERIIPNTSNADLRAELEAMVGREAAA